jgi:hypothetical protein
MKISKQQLKRIIKEEIQKVLLEFDPPTDPGVTRDDPRFQTKTGATSSRRANALLAKPYSKRSEYIITSLLGCKPVANHRQARPGVNMTACDKIPEFIKKKYLSKPGGPRALAGLGIDPDRPRPEWGPPGGPAEPTQKGATHHPGVNKILDEPYSLWGEYRIVKLLGCKPVALYRRSNNPQWKGKEPAKKGQNMAACKNIPDFIKEKYLSK